jgi:hypothetical protein
VTMIENTSPKQTWGFQKGQSGNPAGKPKGARHRTTLLAERLMQDDAEKIVNAVLTAARNGDMMAAKIILDRIAPVRRSSSFDLPRIECREDKPAARAAILDAEHDDAHPFTSNQREDCAHTPRESAQTGPGNTIPGPDCAQPATNGGGTSGNLRKSL